MGEPEPSVLIQLGLGISRREAADGEVHEDAADVPGPNLGKYAILQLAGVSYWYSPSNEGGK